MTEPVVMDSWGVSEPVMPMVTGLLFLGPFLVFVWMLDQLPEPRRVGRG